MRILVAGDFCDRYRVSGKIVKGDFSMFDDVKSVLSKFDFSIVNFEFPIVISDGNPIPKCGPNLKGQKASIDAIKYAGFNVCTLANNHILDQGEECCVQTKFMLEDAGIKTVGAGKNLNEASQILYLHKDDETLAIINCCEHEFSIAEESKAGANPLNPINQYYKILEAKNNADFILVIVHGGHEHYQLPSPRMKELYRFFVDVGADAVVNHHQHCYSGYEVYRGKPIFYGLGNFCFDHIEERDGPWNEGYMVGLNLAKSEKIQYELIPYIQCTEEVAVLLLAREERCEFERRISEFNRIILDERLLRTEVQHYYDSCVNIELRLLEPYDNIFLSKLYRMGLLPRFFKGVKKYAIINHISCESHLDKLIHALNR